MRLPPAAVLLLLAALPAAALSPEADRLNRTADYAASAETAARLYARSIRLQPSNPPAFRGLGYALLELDRPADALKAFRRLDTLAPGDPAVKTALATAISRLPAPRRADIAKGLDWAGQAAGLRPEDPEVWHLLSVLRYINGDYIPAAEAARQALALAADQPADSETTTRYQQQENACNAALSALSPLD